MLPQLAVGSGTLAYSSWATMQKLKWKGALRCQWNDFALVRVSRADKGKVNPTVPFWGGPRTIGGAPVGRDARAAAIRRHVELIEAHLPPRVALVQLKKHLAWYSTGLRGSAALRPRLFAATSSAEVRERFWTVWAA